MDGFDIEAETSRPPITVDKGKPGESDASAMWAYKINRVEHQ
jgi:hypothetical protein